MSVGDRLIQVEYKDDVWCLGPGQEQGMGDIL